MNLLRMLRLQRFPCVHCGRPVDSAEIFCSSGCRDAFHRHGGSVASHRALGVPAPRLRRRGT
ncbi:MAG TPA: DUF2116 family Zn-ribbon domain-containing protein [Gaiellales bacterium]|nr:DUF2116 family Zn-ribbon domain-containing protein [Gaiellales bacterium]